jgi:hypothetical protein
VSPVNGNTIWVLEPAGQLHHSPVLHVSDVHVARGVHANSMRAVELREWQDGLCAVRRRSLCRRCWGCGGCRCGRGGGAGAWITGHQRDHPDHDEHHRHRDRTKHHRLDRPPPRRPRRQPRRIGPITGSVDQRRRHRRPRPTNTSPTRRPRRTRQLRRRLIPPTRILGQPPRNHLIEGHRQPRPLLRGPRRRHRHMTRELPLQTVPRKRPLTGQTLEQHTRQRIHIRTRIELCRREPFRRHVRPGTHHVPRTGHARPIGRPSNPEVNQIREPILGDQDVGRLHITMHQPDLMRCLQRRRHLLDNRHRPLRRQRTLIQHRLQITTLDQPHVHEQTPVDLPKTMNRHHMRLIERSRRPRLQPKPPLKILIISELRQQQLQRHHTTRQRIISPPHLPHATPAQQLHQPVTTKNQPLH